MSKNNITCYNTPQLIINESQIKNIFKGKLLLLLPRCLNNLAEDCMYKLLCYFFAIFSYFCVMCLTPRNQFEFVDKLQRTQSYTTYNAEIDTCDYLDTDEKILVCDSDLVFYS